VNLQRGKRYKVTWEEAGEVKTATGRYIWRVEGGSLVFDRTRKAGGAFAVHPSAIREAQEIA